MPGPRRLRRGARSRTFLAVKLPEGGPHDHAFTHDLPPGPFEHEVAVGWGDADPAQIAYTGNVPAWGLRAIEAWIRRCLGVGWFEMNVDLGVGTPFVELGAVFHAPITPRHPLRMRVWVERVGRSSLATCVELLQEGRLCATGRYVCSFVDAVAMRAIPIPPQMRTNLCRYAARQGRPFEDRPG